MSARPGGFALLIVLWMLVPLSILFLTVSGTARSDTQLTSNLHGAAELDAAAEAGIASAIFALLQGADDPGPIRLALPGAAVSVRTESLSGLVNPNTASPELLRALLLRLGAAPELASSLAAGIVEWRTQSQGDRPAAARAARYRAAGLDYGPPGAPFESLGELRDVLGMTPAMLSALLPDLSLFPDHEPQPGLAPPAVRAALADLGARDQGSRERGDVFRITATATGRGGAEAVRAAIVKIGLTANRRAWRVPVLHRIGRAGDASCRSCRCSRQRPCRSVRASRGRSRGRAGCSGCDRDRGGSRGRAAACPP